MAKKLITLDISLVGNCYIMIGAYVPGVQMPYKTRRITFERMNSLINALGANHVESVTMDNNGRWHAIVETCRKVKCPCKS